MSRKPPSSSIAVSDIVQKLLEFSVVAVITFVASLISQGVGHIQKMGESIEALNRNMAVIVERVSMHDAKLVRHENEIEVLKKTRAP
jgi:hypothetical protein